MINTEEKITFTDVESIFSKEKIERIMKYSKIEQRLCHRNSLFVAQYLNCGVCEGVIFNGIPHAFNYIDNEGERLYFDFTLYRNHLENRLYSKSAETATVLRLYLHSDLGELREKHFQKNEYHLTIEEDNRYREYLYGQTNVNV